MYNDVDLVVKQQNGLWYYSKVLIHPYVVFVVWCAILIDLQCAVHISRPHASSLDILFVPLIVLYTIYSSGV